MKITNIVLLSAVFVLGVTIAEAQAYTVDPALIQTVQGYAAETHHGNEHVDRWNRVLAAFGTIQHTDPMTAQEAQTYADKGWQRWVPVTAALVEIEKAATQPQTDPEPQQTEEPESTDPQIVQVDQTVIDAVTDWRDEQAAGTQHYERWDRVLAAFGTVDRTDAMTAQEAQTYADRGWQRWVQIVDVLKDIEAAAQQQQQQQDAVDPPRPQMAMAQQDQQLTPIQEYRQLLRPQALAIHNEIIQVHTTGMERQSQNPSKYQELDDVWLAYAYGNDVLLPNIHVFDDIIANDPQSFVDAHLVFLKSAIAAAQVDLDRMKAILAEFSSYGPIDSCPPDLRDDRANRNFMSAYVDGTLTHKSSSVHDLDTKLPVVLDGSMVVDVNYNNGPHNKYVNGIHYGDIYYTLSPNDKIELLDGDGKLVDGVKIKNGNFTNSLKDRLCAYHDLTSNSDRHTKLVKQAMLALSIHPEADNIEPMSADKAEQMSKIYDNSQYKWGFPYAKVNDGYPHWQTSLWGEIAKKIHELEIENRS